MERKEAIDVIKKNWPDSSFTMLREALETLIPELKESEDERIKKWLINYFREVCDNVAEKEKNAVLSWLEKQGKISPILSNSSNIGKVEQKPDDKVEPKFKVGDWITDNNSTFQIVKVENEWYYADDGDKICFDVAHQYYHLWTIQDAKDGDALVCKGIIKNSNGVRYERICLFNNLDNAFFTLTKLSNFIEEYDIDVNIDYPDNTVPVTKEQRDALMKAMKNAGYTFDFEKKELKKIEQNNAKWSEEDEEMHRKCICAMRASACGFPEEEKFVEQVDNWLKSLKERCVWKPSEEQMDALHYVTNFDYGGHKATLVSLYEQLKKLMEK